MLAVGFAASYAFARASAAVKHLIWTVAFVALLALPGVMVCCWVAEVRLPEAAVTVGVLVAVPTMRKLAVLAEARMVMLVSGAAQAESLPAKN